MTHITIVFLNYTIAISMDKVHLILSIRQTLNVYNNENIQNHRLTSHYLFIYLISKSIRLIYNYIINALWIKYEITNEECNKILYILIHVSNISIFNTVVEDFIGSLVVILHIWEKDQYKIHRAEHWT